MVRHRAPRKRCRIVTAAVAAIAVFALAYLRITQGYEWIRDTTESDGSPHYEDRAWMN